MDDWFKGPIGHAIVGAANINRDIQDLGVEGYSYVWVAVGGEHIIVANKLVDLVWHEHILDTRVYMIDCTALFGRYLHHYPCFVDEVRTFTNSQKMRQL